MDWIPKGDRYSLPDISPGCDRIYKSLHGCEISYLPSAELKLNQCMFSVSKIAVDNSKSGRWYERMQGTSHIIKFILFGK